MRRYRLSFAKSDAFLIAAREYFGLAAAAVVVVRPYRVDCVLCGEASTRGDDGLGGTIT